MARYGSESKLDHPGFFNSLHSSYHCLINRICCVIRKNASREARDNFLHVELMAQLQNIVVHLHIRPQKAQIVAHVVEQTANFGSKVNNVGWLVFLEKFFRFIVITIK